MNFTLFWQPVSQQVLVWLAKQIQNTLKINGFFLTHDMQLHIYVSL